MNIEISDVIAFLSLIVSIAAIGYARSSSNKANKIAQDNLRLQQDNLRLQQDNLSMQQGIVELGISQSIENAKAKISDVSMIMAPLVAKEQVGKISNEEAATLEIFRKNFKAATQSLINYYDAACSKYIDDKVDKVRFKKTYKNEIRKTIENPDFKEYFDPLTSSYKPILNVYQEWENLENQHNTV